MRRWIKSSAASAAAAVLDATDNRRRRAFGGRLRTLSLWQRGLLALSTLPVVIAGGGSSAYYLHLHQVADAQRLSDFPCAPSPATERRILVLSPHCDDETLGAGAMIAEARKAGVPVTVAFLTNGDGFRVAASRELREVALSPSDFVRFAEVRQQESLAALGELGVAPADIQFFGYPDRGLKPMWETNWSPSTPYRSAYTQRSDCPYPRAYSPHAAYCGRDLFRDLVRLMETVKPTDVYVTHPSDDHPDHSAAAAYADAVLSACRKSAADASWAPSARLHYYLVHRGDWPLPQGLHPDRPLLPPAGMTNLDTRWYYQPASKEAVAAKRRALEKYVSQITVEGRFLRSFIRPNEIFGTLSDSDVCSADPTAAAATVKRPDEESTAEDPVGDDVVRYATPAADLSGVSVRRTPGGDALEVTLTTQGRVSRRVRYRLLLRAMADPISETGAAASAQDAAEGSRFLAIPLNPTVADVRAGRTVLRTIVPLHALGLDTPRSNRIVWVAAETRLSYRLPTIDRTGYHAFEIGDPEPAANRSVPPLP